MGESDDKPEGSLMRARTKLRSLGGQRGGVPALFSRAAEWRRNNGRYNSRYTPDLIGNVSRLSSVIVQPPRILPALACNSHYAHQ